MRGRFREVTEEQTCPVVIGSDKQPIELKDGKIRATYGHSFPVDLGLEPVQPPPQLYYGTARDLAQSILRVGLKPRDRQYVHLSSSVNEAWATASTTMIAGAPLFLTENISAKFLSLDQSEAAPFKRFGGAAKRQRLGESMPNRWRHVSFRFGLRRTRSGNQLVKPCI